MVCEAKVFPVKDVAVQKSLVFAVKITLIPDKEPKQAISVVVPKYPEPTNKLELGVEVGVSVGVSLKVGVGVDVKKVVRLGVGVGVSVSVGVGVTSQGVRVAEAPLPLGGSCGEPPTKI